MQTLTANETIEVKLYQERSDLISESLAKTIHLKKDEDVLPDYGLAKYYFNDMKVYAFASHLTTDAPVILAPMFIPRYFDQIPELDPGMKMDIHGLFLFRLGSDLFSAQAFIADHAFGMNGCPTRILIGGPSPEDKPVDHMYGHNGCPTRILIDGAPSEGKPDFFTFNGMRFYPFLMTDYSVGYYVCDGGTRSPLGWPPYSPKEVGVAIDYPISFDATLGIYMTRAAHVVA